MWCGMSFKTVSFKGSCLPLCHLTIPDQNKNPRYIIQTAGPHPKPRETCGCSPFPAVMPPQHFPWFMGTTPPPMCPPWRWKCSLGTQRYGSWEPLLNVCASPLVSLRHCDLTYLRNPCLKYYVQSAFPDHSRHRPPCLVQTREQAWQSTLSSPVNQPSPPRFPCRAKRIFLGKALMQANVPE